jgi:hypothetical protein
MTPLPSDAVLPVIEASLIGETATAACPHWAFVERTTIDYHRLSITPIMFDEFVAQISEM